MVADEMSTSFGRAASAYEQGRPDYPLDAVEWLWRYFLLGAVIVIPIWLIMRFINAPKGR